MKNNLVALLQKMGRGIRNTCLPATVGHLETTRLALVPGYKLDLNSS